MLEKVSVAPEYMQRLREIATRQGFANMQKNRVVCAIKLVSCVYRECEFIFEYTRKSVIDKLKPTVRRAP